MPKRNFATLEEFKANLHKDGATLVEISGKKVPCILVDPQSYEEILKGSFGNPIGADTVLDIFYDGRDVFVDVQVSFRKKNEGDYFIERNFLLYANNMIEFFEALSESGMMAIAPTSGGHASSNVFVIQLPRQDASERALQIIKSNSRNRDHK